MLSEERLGYLTFERKRHESKLMTTNYAAKITRSDISEGLRALGVVQDDIIYIRADLGQIGKLEGPMMEVFIGGILDVLGENGTLLVPTFTKLNKRWEKQKILFTKEAHPITGALSKRFLKLKGVIRSSHPSHSFAAIGSKADYLLKTHDRNASCFEPIRKLIKTNGKMLLIGCVQSSPGFSTVHLAQNDLGLTRQHYQKYFYNCQVIENKTIKVYSPYEAPGCSVAFDRFYKNYKMADNLEIGKIGNALAYCIDARKAYKIEKEVLEKNPRFTICDDMTCVSCHLLRGYNKQDMISSIFAILKKKLSK